VTGTPDIRNYFDVPDSPRFDPKIVQAEQQRKTALDARLRGHGGYF
jgi:hypothetical protein